MQVVRDYRQYVKPVYPELGKSPVTQMRLDMEENPDFEVQTMAFSPGDVLVVVYNVKED